MGSTAHNKILTVGQVCKTFILNFKLQRVGNLARVVKDVDIGHIYGCHTDWTGRAAN